MGRTAVDRRSVLLSQLLGPDSRKVLKACLGRSCIEFSANDESARKTRKIVP